MIANIFIVGAYLSLVIELFFFPVPSVASTYQLVYQAESTNSGNENIGRLNSIRNWPSWKKTTFLILPAILNVVIFLIPLLYVANIVSMDFLISFNFESTILTIIGIVLISMGRLITITSAIRIRKNNSQKEDDFKLHNKGFFALSRNPILIGMHLLIIGCWLIFPSLLFMVGIVFYLMYMDFKVGLEEDFLFNQFGEPYKNYQEQTRRYL